ncbi:Type IV leader peptidase family protein [compost metagenome]
MMVGFILLLLLCHIAFLDVAKRRVLNFSVAIVFVLGGLNLMFKDVSWMLTDWSVAAISCLVVFGFFYLFYAFGIMGGGDVKLAAALAFCLGLEQFFWVWVVSVVFAVAYGLVWKLLTTIELTYGLFQLNLSKHGVHRLVPYGALMCVSVFVVIYTGA